MEIFSRGPLVLNLSNCDIDSPLPSRVFDFVMTTCDLHKNKFYGEIPDIFGDMSILNYFDISSNNLSGSFPLGIQTLISLQFLDISGNPSMREATTASSTVFRPDFSRMFTPKEKDKFSCPEAMAVFVWIQHFTSTNIASAIQVSTEIEGCARNAWMVGRALSLASLNQIMSTQTS